jgi:methylmalonyl-CoA mutase N-terminal domain/subunit
VRATRDAEKCQRALIAVGSAARDGQNLVSPIVAAVEAKATIGEIADALRQVFGEYKETATV